MGSLLTNSHVKVVADRPRPLGSLEKIYGKVTRHKLAVNTKNATIRFKIGSSAEECARVEQFLTKVANSLQGNPEFCDLRKTVRGNLAHHVESDTLYIVMALESGAFSQRFFENEM